MCGGLIKYNKVDRSGVQPWGAMKLRETPTAPKKEGTKIGSSEKGTVLDSHRSEERTGWIRLPVSYVHIILTQCAYVCMYAYHIDTKDVCVPVESLFQSKAMYDTTRFVTLDHRSSSTIQWLG